MNHEIELLNKVLEGREQYNEAYDSNIGNILHQYLDVWAYIKNFVIDYGEPPSKDVVKGKFPEFDFVITKNPTKYYIDQAREKSILGGLRQSLGQAAEAMQKGDDPLQILRKIQFDTSGLMRDSGRLQDTDITDWKDRAELVKARIESDGDKTLGVPSGIRVIDTIFGGWQPGDFIVVMAWTGVGKSFLTRLFALNAWKQGYKPLVISLEMDKNQEMFRMDTILNQGEYFTNNQLTSGNELDYDVYTEWAEKTFSDTEPFYLVTSDGIDSADPGFVDSKIDQYKPDMVVLDYHQLFDAPSGGNDVEKAKALSKAFKRLAVKHSVPIIDVASVTMDSGHEDRPPELNEIAWSKQLAYDSDMVLALQRKPDSQIFDAITRKTRRCPQFAFKLMWDLNTGKWSEMFDYTD